MRQYVVMLPADNLLINHLYLYVENSVLGDTYPSMSVTEQSNPMIMLLTQLQGGIYITDILPCERVV